jgi:hypothetical protein
MSVLLFSDTIEVAPLQQQTGAELIRIRHNQPE